MEDADIYIRGRILVKGKDNIAVFEKSIGVEANP